MTVNPSAATATARTPTLRRRVFLLALLVIGLAVVASSAELHAWLIAYLPVAEGIIRQRPVVGVSVFILFAALSAMLAFVSSAVIVPVGVYVWGKAVTVLLLWIGWILGGIAAYTVSRFFGRPVVRRLHGTALDRYEQRVSRRAPFVLVLLLQAALPSEVPGYILGLAGYSFWKYLGALALAELPYAIATAYLGASFIERQTSVLIGAGLLLAGFAAWALRALQRHFPQRHFPKPREE